MRSWSAAARTRWRGDLVLVLGENGLDLAPQQGLPRRCCWAGNWIGPLLVAAAELGVKRLLLFGYQGKLIKLAGASFTPTIWRMAAWRSLRPGRSLRMFAEADPIAIGGRKRGSGLVGPGGG